MGIVYIIVNMRNNKAYIGQTRRSVRERMTRHKDMKWGRCTLVKKAIKKHGWEAFDVRVLWQGANELLDAKEVEFIAAYGTLAPRGYNATAGGDANPMSSEAGRQSVKDSWADPTVRQKHVDGRKAAWVDPTKRGNIMAGRAASNLVAQAKALAKQCGAEANAKRTATWEARREKRLAGLTGKAREQKLARMNRDRERHRKKVAARTAETIGWS